MKEIDLKTIFIITKKPLNTLIKSDKDEKNTQRSERLYPISNRDLEELMEAKEKLKKSELRYRSLLESSSMGLMELDMKKWQISYVNQKLLDIIGYSREELNKNNLMAKVIHPDDISEIMASIEDGDLECRIISKSGQLKWLAGTKIGQYNENNDFISLRIWLDDITEKKLREQKIIESEEKYRFLFNNSPFPIFLIDSKGLVLDCNPNFEELTGYKKEEMINRKYADLSLVHPKYLESLLERLKKITKVKKYPILEIELYRKDGSIIWVKIQSSLVKSGNKTFIQVIGDDITLQKEAEEIVKEENKRLLELDTLRKTFLDTAAHELKTPLTSVYGAIQILYELNKDSLNPESLEFIKIAKNGSERLKNLILNLLDISRLEFNKSKIYKKSHDLVDIIKNCISDINYLIYKRRHIIILDLPEKLYINIDKSGIERVIINLLSNAIKYTPPEGRIEVALHEDKNHIELSVKDSGIGLTKEEINVIFEKFNRIERSNDEVVDLIKEGTGLGLNISKEIVEMHGGQIWVSSEGRNKGSSFIVRLPVNKN